MSNLLIHSMSEFSQMMLDCMKLAKVKNIAEVGAEFGGMSLHLADYCAEAGGTMTTIDPGPKEGFSDWADGCDHVNFIADTSLNVMPGLTDIDAWVIDGDHNYYTVSNELKIADENARRDDKPLFAFLHDVSWPCARRDCYYNPETIPAEHRHPYNYEAGVTLGNDGWAADTGFRGTGEWAWALQAGGPKNGVLTAVEDFVSEANTEERPLAFAHIPAVFGLGVVFDMTADWAQDVSELLVPFHENRLMASLEINRLRNYLKVIEWQDQQAAAV